MERLFHQEGRRSGATSQLYSEPRGAESSDGLLRLGGLGHNGESPWEGLLVHQQLALRAHGGQPSFHRGLCLERFESDHPPVRDWFDPLRRWEVRLLGLEGRVHQPPYLALCLIQPENVSPCFEAHAQPVGYGMVLRHRGSLLFLAQSFLGGVLAHYRVGTGAFYGLDIARWRPYNLARTWHLQLAIFWIATAWVGGGLFLASWVGGGEPRHQRTGVYALLGALVVVVVGSLAGESLGINDKLGQLWFWFGHQGSEYLDLGRFWQFLLAVGLLFWLFLMFRALKPAFQNPDKRELSSLFLYTAVAIPVFYLPALFYGPHTNFAVIDNWRFWIIHLWVEGFFELFATVLVAIMFHQMGVVSTKTATRLIYLDAILYLSGGIIGTGHHWYFTGQGTLNMGLASCFSALEVVPLTLLTLDAWDFIKLRKAQCSACGHDLAWGQKWSIYFLMAVGVWNFVGAGIFGFLINLPIVSYFEVGTTLTANHAHAALFGVFGMLALAVLVFCLRAMQSDTTWKETEKFVRVGFWGANVGLALMIILDLFPGGVIQLWDSIANGYWHARRLTFLMGGTYHKLEWLRMVGDVVFLFAGALPITLGALRSMWKRDLSPTP